MAEPAAEVEGFVDVPPVVEDNPVHDVLAICGIVSSCIASDFHYC